MNLGADFSGTDAVQTSRNLNARAFTVGNHIAWEYSSGTDAGRHLLAIQPLVVHDTATAEQSPAYETATDIPAAQALIPFDRNPLSAPSEMILFNCMFTDSAPNNFQLVYTAVGGTFDTRPGQATKTIPGLRSGNVSFFIDQAWNGRTQVTVKLQVQRLSNKTFISTYDWTFGEKTLIPTTITQQEGEGERPLPSIYSYKIGPDHGLGDDYLHQTILETFGQRTCNIAFADLSPVFRAANPRITTSEQITAHFFGTSSNNGTFTVSTGDMIYDRHGGGMPNLAVFQAALTTMKEIYVDLPQIYSAQPGVVLGRYIVRRILKTDGRKRLKKIRQP